MGQHVNSQRSRSRYYAYLGIGVVTGLATILLRESIGWLLPFDTPRYYMLSVMLAYGVGILMSYTAHRRITFSRAKPYRAGFAPLRRYALIAVAGLATTALLAMVLRYLLPFDELLGPYKPALAFGFAAFATSALTYILTANYVFTDRGPESVENSELL